MRVVLLLQDALLKYDEKITEDVDISKLYVLKKGTYVVTVFREVTVGKAKIELQGKTSIVIP